MVEKTFVIGHRRVDGSHSLTRLPDGLVLSASGWDGVWAACPEFGVRWASVRFEDALAREQVLERWGSHPDIPTEQLPGR